MKTKHISSSPEVKTKKDLEIDLRITVSEWKPDKYDRKPEKYELRRMWKNVS